MSYVGSVAKSVTAIDRTRLRGWSAVRRGLLVGITFVGVSFTTSPTIGALAAVAGLYVGLQDRNGPPRYTARLMTVQSVLFCGVVLLGGLLNAWVGTLILIVCAAIAGLTAAHDKSISRMFADVLNVFAFLGLSTMAEGSVLESAAAVLAAGLLQAVTTLMAGHWATDLPERRPVATALQTVADHLADAQVRLKTTTGPAAEKAIAEADAAVSGSDLSHDRRRALRKILGDAEQLRLEASAIRVRRAFNVETIDEDEVNTALALAAASLRAAARALIDQSSAPVVGGRIQMKALDDLAADSAQARVIAKDPSARPTARSIAAQTVRVNKHVARLFGADSTRERSRDLPLGDHVVDDILHPGPSDFRSALRLAVAAAIGLGVARLLNLPHGAWVAATSVALLRPDHRALTSDTIARALGVSIGAAAVLPIVALTGTNFYANLSMLILLAILACAVTSANEGLFVVAVTVFTVFSRSAVGENPVEVAFDRLLDVLVGCAIAMLLLAILPLRQGKLLGRQLAEYAQATASWLDAVAKQASGTSVKVRKHRKAVRRARLEVQHGLDLRRIEPLGPGMSQWRGQIIFSRIHDSSRAATAAEVSLLHGAKPSAMAPQIAEHAAELLRCTAAESSRHSKSGVSAIPPPPDLSKAGDDEVTQLLIIADDEALASVSAVSEPLMANPGST